MSLRSAAAALDPTAYWYLEDLTSAIGSYPLTETGTVVFGDDEYEAGSGSMNVDDSHLNYLDRAPVISASNTPFTMMVLCKYVDNTNTQVALASADDEFNSGGGTLLGATSGDLARFNIGGSALDGGTLTNGRWYLLVGRMDGTTSGQQSLWLGDVTGDSWTKYNKAIGGGNQVDPAARTKIGGQVKSISQSVREWAGEIDEAAIWDNEALSDDDIDTLWDGLGDGIGVGLQWQRGRTTIIDLAAGKVRGVSGP